MFGRKSPPLLGVDISTSSIKIVELAKSGDRFSVEAYAAEATPDGSVTDKQITDPEPVAEAIRRALKRSGAKAKIAAAAISGQHAVSKVIQMPSNLGDRELEGQIVMQADQYIPFDMEEVSFDWEVQGENANDPEMLDVLLVATKSENVESRQVAMELAGLTCKVVDVERYSLENSVKMVTHQLPDDGLDHTIAICDFGATTTTFSVLHDLSITYSRDLSFGGKQLTEEIMRAYGLTNEEAGRAKKEGGLPNNYEPEILASFVQDMAQQVNRSLNYYQTAGTAQPNPELLVICGGCAKIAGVADQIAEQVGISSVIAEPLGKAKLASKAKAAGVEKDDVALMIAFGLALRSFD
jgi:type IV pilus assembly protein PilM